MESSWPSTGLPPGAGLRIVTLIPSATEIVALLGLAERLVGRSHECDFPESVRALPACTRPRFDPQGSSRTIHERVNALLEQALSIYAVDAELLSQLKPTHILTQDQCEVCAASLAEVEQAVAGLVDSCPQILSLQPASLADLWADIERVGRLLGVDPAPVLAALQARVKACAEKAQAAGTGKRVACIEWTDPLMVAGNWVPELVTLAGGINLFGEAGQHSPWLDWSKLVAADPDLLVVMPCGYDLAQTREAVAQLAGNPHWPRLRAVQSGEVYIVDGNHYFNRPGPRLVDSLEILAEILHPGLFPFSYAPQAWSRLAPGK